MQSKLDSALISDDHIQIGYHLSPVNMLSDAAGHHKDDGGDEETDRGGTNQAERAMPAVSVDAIELLKEIVQ